MATDTLVKPEQYSVVVNDEQQFSIWLAGHPLPDGWRLEGTKGSREECLAHIATVWTDMKPACLRS